MRLSKHHQRKRKSSAVLEIPIEGLLNRGIDQWYKIVQKQQKNIFYVKS
jgi:hypothetical protein